MSQNFGFHGRVLRVDLTNQTVESLEVDASVYRHYLGGYGLGAWLMWKYFPAQASALAPEACFAICAGLFTGAKTPFSGRIQIVGKSPLTGTWADSNSGGSVASHLRRAGYDALLVHGRASQPTILVIQDEDVRFESAEDLWGQEIPPVFDALKARYGGKRDVGVSAIGPAGEKGSRIASVMNDRYHAFGRQGFGALYGSKNLKAIVVGGSGTLPIADRKTFRALCSRVNEQYKRDIGPFSRFMVYMAKPRWWLAWAYRIFARFGIKIVSPTASFRQLWADHGTTGAVAISVENGDAPVMNWRGVGTRDFPLASKSVKLDGAAVNKMVTKKLSCGDCPAPCKGIVRSKSRGLKDVRRPDYETLVGFGANLLNDDLDLVTACHDACNRYGLDAVSSSATLAWVCEAIEHGDLTSDDLDGINMCWGNGEGALELTIRMGAGEGCGDWLRHGSKYASEYIGRGTEKYAIHVHGSEPAYHDTRFTSLMGVTYISDPTPGRHTAGSASWNETFASAFPLPSAVPKSEQNVSWKGQAGKGITQAHYSNSHQVMNGLGLCMFTLITGNLPWLELLNALTGWGMDERELLMTGERIQNLRNAFNRREGILPDDFVPHPRMLGQGDGLLPKGPLKGITVPLISLRRDYFAAMDWDINTGLLSRERAQRLEMDTLLGDYVAP